MRVNKNNLPVLLILAIIFISICTGPKLALANDDLLKAQQQADKETLFKEFNDKKRSDPKDAYRVAKAYLEKFGKDADDNTKYVKEWVVAYESVMSRSGGTDPKGGTGASSKPDSTSTNPGKPLELGGTTWQMKGEENGNAWAEIFVFKPGGRFQYEKYGADGSANVRAGTWRQLDKSIFAALLGPDGNTVATVRAELKGACLKATLVSQGQPEWRFLMETDSASDACRNEREAELRYESDPNNARRLFTGLINAVGKTTTGLTAPTISFTGHKLVNIPEFDGCAMLVQEESDETYDDPLLGVMTSWTKLTIPLSDIDLGSIKVSLQDVGSIPSGYYVVFETKNKVKTISIAGTSSNRSRLSPRDAVVEDTGTLNLSLDGWSVYLGDQERANRAARALSQIVKACQKNQ